MLNHYQRKILAEAAKYGGANISVPEQMAEAANAHQFRVRDAVKTTMNGKTVTEAPALMGGEAVPTIFGWGKHQFESKFRELLGKMGFERGIVHMKTEGKVMKIYFANAAKARDFVIAFNGIARRRSMDSVASVATQFDKIKVPTGTAAIVTLDLTMVRGENYEETLLSVMEDVSVEGTLTEGYETKILDYLEDAGFKKGDAWFENGILYVANTSLIAGAKKALEDHSDIYELPKIRIEEGFVDVSEEDHGLHTDLTNPKGKAVVDGKGKVIAVYRTERAARKHAETGKPVKEEVEGLTEAPYKTSTGTPKFVGKYQFTPFVEGSISGWFLRVQGFAKEVGFIEKPASKNTKTSVAPYKVYFHTEVSGHPQLKANALPGNETRVIQSNQFRFAPKQLLKGVAMWMDAYGYRMVGEGLESVDFHEGREWNIKYGTSMKDVVDEMGRSGWKPVDKMPSGNFSGNISFRKGQSKAHLVLKGGNPEKWVHESVEVVDGDINEAKKKLTSDQKAALKAYKLSCDMRDRDDLTPDMYRHYDKRAKADAEACKKLGLGKEDGVYESVHEDSTQVIEGRIKQHDSVYFDSYTAALAAARAKAEKKGYKIDEEDWASQVTHGYPGRPSVGKTTNKKINLTKNGKPVKPRLIISVYGMKNQFELTSYISESVEVDGDDINESVKPKLITPKEMADYKVKKVLAVGTKPNNESIVATSEWGEKKFVQLEKMGKTSNINQIVQATFFDTEKEAMDEMRDRGFKIHA